MRGRLRPLEDDGHLQVFRDPAAWESCERSLAAAGVRLPLPHRAEWALARRGVEPLRVGLRAPDGGWAGAFAMHAAASRALPGYRLLRIERFGEGVPRTLWASAVDALAEVARSEPRVLRLSVEVFSREAETRAGLGELLARAGFARMADCRNYSRTLTLDLRPTEPALFASLSRNTRRNIRSVEKLPVQVRTIDDRRMADRLEVLSRETFARTGARYEALWDWPGVIEVSRRFPDAARLVGLFRTDREGPDALLGFSWGWWNGESVSYAVGASTRPADLPGVKVGYPMMWDLIQWARRTGAAWFDLGGVSEGRAGSGDPVGGISDFKRFFSMEAAEVAEDWELEPRWLPARLGRFVNVCAASFLRAAGR